MTERQAHMMSEKDIEKQDELEEELNDSAEETAEETEEKEEKENAEETAEEISEEDKLKAELAESKDKYLRLMAEYDNFRKRSAKERLELSAAVKGDTVSDSR